MEGIRSQIKFHHLNQEGQLGNEGSSRKTIRTTHELDITTLSIKIFQRIIAKTLLEDYY